MKRYKNKLINILIIMKNPVKYEDIKNNMTLFEQTYNEFKKIPDPMFKMCGYPDFINILIKEDLSYVGKLVDLYYNTAKMQLDIGVSMDDVLKSPNFIKFNTNDKKDKYLRFSKDVIKWLLEADFFTDIYEQC